MFSKSDCPTLRCCTGQTGGTIKKQVPFLPPDCAEAKSFVLHSSYLLHGELQSLVHVTAPHPPMFVCCCFFLSLHPLLQTAKNMFNLIILISQLYYQEAAWCKVWFQPISSSSFLRRPHTRCVDWLRTKTSLQLTHLTVIHDGCWFDDLMITLMITYCPVSYRHRRTFWFYFLP